MSTAEPTRWKHLARKPGSTYRQLFVNGRIAARTLYSYFVPGGKSMKHARFSADRVKQGDARHRAGRRTCFGPPLGPLFQRLQERQQVGDLLGGHVA